MLFLSLVLLFIWSELDKGFAFQGCGSVMNNSLKSPGYPNNYPSDMHCVYSIPIPQGMALNISFEEFLLEQEEYEECSYDYLKITDGKSHTFGVYCGEKTGESVVVAGDQVMITFYSDDIEQRRGFLIFFTPIPVAFPEVILFHPIVRTLPGFKLSLCSTKGTPPVYTALTRNSTVLINTTGIYITIRLHEEGNYSCVATGKYGADVKEFSVIFNDCGNRCSYEWRSLNQGNFLSCKNLTSLANIHCVPKATQMLEVISSNFSSLRLRMLSNLTNVWNLNLASNAITFLPDDVFPRLKLLERLYLSSNAITFLPEGLFANLTNLHFLDLSSNAIAFLKENAFSPLRNLKYLYLASNVLTVLPNSVFAPLTKLQTLALQENAIKFLPSGIFAELKVLRTLSLAKNNIQSLPNGLLSNLTILDNLNLTSNAIKSLPHDLFATQTEWMKHLILTSNTIESLPEGIFSRLTRLKYLQLDSNNIQNLPGDVFCPLKILMYLDLSFNKLQYLPKGLFSCLIYVQIIFLHNNKITTIPSDAIVNSVFLKNLILSDNPIKTIQPGAVTRSVNSLKMNPLNSKNEAVKAHWKESTFLKPALAAAGFEGTPNNDSYSYTFLPCPVGTFSNFSSKGAEGCIQCPPGGFYSDDVGYVATNCKKCPNGSFVSYEKTPGTRPQDCRACPLGTETDFFAGYRACQCLEGFYRTDMFDKCYKCGLGGLECKDDYASLKSGHWWEWRNETHKDIYRLFIANMLSSSPALDAFSVRFSYPIPTPYKCPVEGSCKGGLDSPCKTGYEGPLCAVCSSGYYKQLQICTRCPSKTWIAVQLSIIAVILFMIIAALAWTNKRKDKKAKESPLIDMFLSKLKIVIGFYQVTYGLLEVFSYIQWPDSLEGIAKYSGILQLNILQIAPIQCLFTGLQVDAFESLFAIMAINAAVIGLSGIYYAVQKALILKSRIAEVKEKSRRITQTKELVYKNLFFVLYVTYLSTCSKTAAVLPLACQDLCRDENEESCYKYLKADYMTKCQGSKYQYFLIGAYISTVYIIALPTASFIVLWRQRRVMFASKDAKSCHNPGSRLEIITGLRFLFENYKPRSWYWELVEMSRKVILTSTLILVGQESRSYIGLTLVIAGMYGMLFSWIRPMQDAFENRLMSTSLAVTIVNLAVGAVSRIPAENTPSSEDQFADAVLFKILVLGANVSVIALLVVQYAIVLHRYITKWCENPHFSLSCLLALLLPLNGLQGDIHGLAESNVVSEQLETGQMDTPTVTGAVQDSGAIDTILPSGQQGEVAKEDRCQNAQYRKKRCDKHTQTDQFEPSYVDGMVDGLQGRSL